MFAGAADIVSDDLPLVEFTGPKAVDMSPTAKNYLTLTQYAQPVAPPRRGRRVGGAIDDPPRTLRAPAETLKKRSRGSSALFERHTNDRKRESLFTAHRRLSPILPE